MDELLRAELVKRIGHDDAVRERLARDGSVFEGYNAQMEAVHRDNARWLGAIVDARGWPGRATVGDEGASAAMRILQHAIGEPALMRRMLPLVQDVDPADVARLEDRIRA